MIGLPFEQAHKQFIQHHLERRTGERKGRLERGHQHAEQLFLKQVWWPIAGDFDDLHPEYEILDWRGRPYFADFAYLPSNLKFIIEIKGYSVHVASMDRQRYSMELNRELFLQALGYRVVSMAYDDIADRPELCIMLLKNLLGAYRPGKSMSGSSHLEAFDRELIRLAFTLARPIRPGDIAGHFGVSHQTAIKHLNILSQKGWMAPVIRSREQKRITLYTLAPDAWQYLN